MLLIASNSEFHIVTLVLVCVNTVCREKEALSVKLNELKSELSTVTIQRDELEKSNLETRLQVLLVNTVYHKILDRSRFLDTHRVPVTGCGLGQLYR